MNNNIATSAKIAAFVFLGALGATTMAAGAAADGPVPAAYATHASPGYIPGFASTQTLTIMNTFEFSTNSNLYGLLWYPDVPTGWTIINATGDGSPEIDRDGQAILFTAFYLTNHPMVFSYTVNVPAHETGAKFIGGNVFYYLDYDDEVEIAVIPAPMQVPMLLTITANAMNKVYGTADPAPTYTITSGELAGGDSITGAMTRATGENVGTYEIQKNSLGAGPNYVITYVPANLTITPLPANQTITFDVIPDQVITRVLTLAATASSGLPVTFTVGSGPAGITGGTSLSFTGTGVVSIVASQAGNVNWDAAPNVVNTFNVTGVSIKGIVNADFDGDRKADPAVYDENTGAWTVLLSGAGYYKGPVTGLLGGLGWTSAAADYDGDGRADPAVYQESTGNLAVRLSGVEYVQVNLAAFMGGPGWVPTTADYDGDGLDDPAVYQAATGDWKMKRSSSGYQETSLNNVMGSAIQGAAEQSDVGYTVVAADYDGDGVADPAVYKQADGTWIVRLSSASYLPLELADFLGGTDWNAAPGDYDGDRLADPAVRNALGTGEWRVMLSSANYTLLTAQLGL